MSRRAARRWVLGTLPCLWLACGSRTGLDPGPNEGGPGGIGAGTAVGGAAPCEPAPEMCNGRDDDCNGVVDEDDPALGAPCETGLSGPCAEGELACEGGALVCNPIHVAAEVCNGLDDDCNGLVDDGDPGGGAPCDTGLLGACAAGTLRCIDAALGCAPDGAPEPESCDGLDSDCNGVVDDPPVCTRRVFVTSQIFTGDLGGLDGADAKCQALADAAGLGGAYKAWLSTTTVDARDRLTQVGKPYVLVDGTVLADDWDEFASLHHQAPIDVNELLGPAPLTGCCPPLPKAFTATSWDGTLEVPVTPNSAPATCTNWSSAGGFGGVGRPNSAVWGNWSWVGSIECHVGAALYCLEQ